MTWLCFLFCIFLLFRHLSELGRPVALFLAIAWLVWLGTRSTGQTRLALPQLESSSAMYLNTQSSTTARAWLLVMPCRVQSPCLINYPSTGEWHSQNPGLFLRLVSTSLWINNLVPWGKRPFTVKSVVKPIVLGKAKHSPSNLILAGFSCIHRM